MSFEAQQEYYTNMLSGKPGLIFCGIYADEGISGFKDGRPGFQDMMRDARAGRIDEIYTKSISRFARNTLLFLETVRELQALGVTVYFEKENISTSSSECELLMSIYAIVAEEERRQVCSNVSWSIRRKFASGHPLINPCRVYGFREGEDGAWEIDEEQAEVIRYIFNRYVDGALPVVIAEELNANGIPTGHDHSPEWSDQRILRTLKNEKYKGDCLLQKCYVNSHGKEVQNKGVLTQYYIEEHHEPIVSPELWEKANARIMTRKTNTYPFSGRLHCPKCGARMRHAQYSYGGSWQCTVYCYKGKSVCSGMFVKDTLLASISGPEHDSGEWQIKEVEENGEISYCLVPYTG